LTGAQKEGGQGVQNFDLPDGRSPEMSNIVICLPLHLRRNAALAMAAPAKVRFVRTADLSTSRSERLLSAQSGHWNPQELSKPIVLEGRIVDFRCGLHERQQCAGKQA
jgi:hypothetical protein